MEQLKFKMKNLTKILIVLPTDSIGGAERVAQNLASYLFNNNYEVTVYFLSKGCTGGWLEFEEWNGISLVYCDAKSEVLGLTPFFKWLVSNAANYQFVYSTHLHINSLICFARMTKLLNADKHIARESTVIFDRFKGFKRLLFKSFYKLYQNVDFLVFQTEYMRKSLFQVVPKIKSVKNSVIRNPLNIEKINELSSEQVVVKDTFNILYVGRLTQLKNVNLLVNSIVECAFGRSQNFHCYILGDGPEKHKLYKLIEELNLLNNFTFLGNVKNPYKYMAKADLGVVTSLKEGFPNVIIEMMAAGTKSIITTPCAGDLSTLPGVVVTEDFSVSNMTYEIDRAYKIRTDKRTEFLEYARSISTKRFWSQVESNLS